MRNQSRPEYLSHQLFFLEISPWNLEFKFFNELPKAPYDYTFKQLLNRHKKVLLLPP